MASNGGPVLSGIPIASDSFELTVDRESGTTLLHLKLKTNDTLIEGHFSSGAESTKALLGEEMNPSVRHKVYMKAFSLQQTVF